MSEQLQKWDVTGVNLPSKCGPSVFVPPQISAESVTSREKKKLFATDIFELLQNNTSNGLIAVFGEAGMGKTTACRDIIEAWTEKKNERYQGMNDQFKLALYIPLRRIENSKRCITDLVCDEHELGFLPLSHATTLRAALTSERTLIILDSYEELAKDFDNIDQLIKGDLYPMSTVVITSRPGSDLAKKLPTSHICAQLQNMSEETIKQYIGEYFELDAPEVDKKYKQMREIFMGSTFLQRPRHLALACHVFKNHPASEGKMSDMTVTGVFNTILNEFIPTYAEKKKMKEVRISSSAESPISNGDIPKDIKYLLKNIGEVCFAALRKQEYSFKCKESDLQSLSYEHCVDLGLFTVGESADDPVQLPHSLFQEYLSAVYLVSDKLARDEVLQGFRTKFDRNPAYSLLDTVRPLENVVVFMVGLNPSFIMQLTDYLRVKKQDLGDLLGCDLSYEDNLVQECNEIEHKRAFCATLLEEKVQIWQNGRGVYSPVSCDAIPKALDNEQQRQYIQKYFACKIECDSHAQRITPNDPQERPISLDKFVISFVRQNKINIAYNELYIHRADICTDTIRFRMEQVRELYCVDCTLYSSPSAAERSVNTSIKTMILENVTGIQCLSDIIPPAVSRRSILPSGMLTV